MLRQRRKRERVVVKMGMQRLNIEISRSNLFPIALVYMYTRPSKLLFVPSTNNELESDVKLKKINRRNRGQDGAKTKTINQDCTRVKTEEQPNDKLFEPSKVSSVPSSGVGPESDVMPKIVLERFALTMEMLRLKTWIRIMLESKLRRCNLCTRET